MEQETARPLILWNGFPACGLLLKKLLKAYPGTPVFATRPGVPFENLEHHLGQEIHWLQSANDICQYEDQLEDRNIIVSSGWIHKEWMRISNSLKSKNNAVRIGVVDNSIKNNLRQFLGGLYFRAVLRQQFDAMFVPGKHGEQLLARWGMPPERIYPGAYGAFEEIYRDTNPILSRKNEILFVGQLIERKGVDVMLRAFKRYRIDGGSWTLRVVGSGALESACHGDGILFDGFLQPNEVSSAMNQSKAFILPSREEHWGTVVCEAAACGSFLITTKEVGSSADLVRRGVNGIELQNLKEFDLYSAFWSIQRSTDQSLETASRVSKALASTYDSDSYLAAFNRMATDFGLGTRSSGG